MTDREARCRLADSERELVTEGPAPATAQLMKAVPCRTPFSDPEWIFERKLDGIRCLAIRDGARTRLLSRNDLDLGGRFPEIRAAVAAQPPPRFVVDGEIVAFDHGQTSFARLTARRSHPVAVFYYVFDLLWCDGSDVQALPLRTRKRLLRDAVSSDGPIRLSTHRNAAGEEMFREACSRGWEGVIAKRADSAYRPTRSRDWLRPRHPRRARWAAARPPAREHAVRRRRDDSRTRRHRVTPTLVAQLAFTEWTRAGRLRHPRYLGLRDDKPAEQVIREQ